MSAIAYAIIALLVLGTLPIAWAAGVFGVAAYRLALFRGRSATATKAVLIGLTILGLLGACITVLVATPVPPPSARSPRRSPSRPVQAAVVVMEPGDTRWIEWELKMIRELGLPARFFIVTAPDPEQRGSRPIRRIRTASARLVARLTRTTPPSWHGFSSRLSNAGFEPPPYDPGPGYVLGVDDTFRVVLLRAGLTRASQFVSAILAQGDG